MVIPLGAVGFVGVVVSSGSSELTQDVKNDIPKVLTTVAKPAFSRNFRLDAERVPELGN
jgi:D-aminopeptidase